MLGAIKRAVLKWLHAAGYSLMKNAELARREAEHGRVIERQAELDQKLPELDRKLSELDQKLSNFNQWAAAETAKLDQWVTAEKAGLGRWIADRRSETDQWVMAKEKQTLAKLEDTNLWVAAKEAEIDARVKSAKNAEAEAAVKSEEVKRWATAKEAEIEESLRWARNTESEIARRLEEALHWVGLTNPPLALDAAGTPLVPVGRSFSTECLEFASTIVPGKPANRLTEQAAVLDRVKPWAGYVPKGYLVDSFGILTDATFRPDKTDGPFGGRYVQTKRPTVVGDGEGWFEIIDWLQSASQARDQYVAVSLGASYGLQVVGPWKALQAINPMPVHLVAVEAVPENCTRIAKFMRDNGIDPADHCIIQAAIGLNNDPVLFPVGAPGSGCTGCVNTNAAKAREVCADLLLRSGQADQVLRNLLIYNSTGIVRDLGDGLEGEVKYVSAVTLPDVIGQFGRVDLLEVDLQGLEVDVLAPYMDLLHRKVRRVHIGTHGDDLHATLRAMFVRAGWEIVFDFGQMVRHETELGPFDANDGILTVRNPVV